MVPQLSVVKPKLNQFLSNLDYSVNPNRGNYLIAFYIQMKTTINCFQFLTVIAKSYYSNCKPKRETRNSFENYSIKTIFCCYLGSLQNKEKNQTSKPTPFKTETGNGMEILILNSLKSSRRRRECLTSSRKVL